VPESSRDVVVSDLTFDLRPQSGEIPLAPLVYSLDVQIDDEALGKAVTALLILAKSKLPVEVEFENARFTEEGAEITVAAGLNRFLKAKATAVVDIEATDAEAVSVQIREIRTLGKLPIESMVGPVIDKALDKAAARPGIERNPSRHRALLIEPNALLASMGLPLEFASSGRWTVQGAPGRLTARFTSS
jgi:hypothetical protein